MIVFLRHFLGWMVSAFRSREDLVLENRALRQQLLALHAQRPRPRSLNSATNVFFDILLPLPLIIDDLPHVNQRGLLKPKIHLLPQPISLWNNRPDNCIDDFPSV